MRLPSHTTRLERVRDVNGAQPSPELISWRLDRAFPTGIRFGSDVWRRRYRSEQVSARNKRAERLSPADPDDDRRLPLSSSYAATGAAVAVPMCHTFLPEGPAAMPSVNRMISETRARACASLLMLMTFSGCTRYVLAQSTLHVGDEPSAEVTASPAWHSLVTRIHQVALYAPDDCANFSTSGATGNAESVGTVLQTHCGVEMSEIERALTASGYVVSSWMTLQRMISTEHMTPLDTARRLGAQVLFQVNSLERSRRTRPMQNARWEREYRRAQADGTATGPAELSSMDVSQLRALLAPNEHFYTDGERLGAGLDVNAVMVSSGQTIWFYRWLKVEPLPPDLRFSMFLFQSGSGPWLPVAGVGQGDALEAHSAKARESEAVSVQGSPENRIADAYHALIREVIRDFVERFRGTRAGGES